MAWCAVLVVCRGVAWRGVPRRDVMWRYSGSLGCENQLTEENKSPGPPLQRLTPLTAHGPMNIKPFLFLSSSCVPSISTPLQLSHLSCCHQTGLSFFLSFLFFISFFHSFIVFFCVFPSLTHIHSFFLSFFLSFSLSHSSFLSFFLSFFLSSFL